MSVAIFFGRPGDRFGVADVAAFTVPVVGFVVFADVADFTVLVALLEAGVTVGLALAVADVF